MGDGKGDPLRRPEAMTLDIERCIDCGACDELAPAIMARSERITVTQVALEAMAVCPVGALRWLEGETRSGRERHGHEHSDDA